MAVAMVVKKLSPSQSEHHHHNHPSQPFLVSSSASFSALFCATCVFSLVDTRICSMIAAIRRSVSAATGVGPLPCDNIRTPDPRKSPQVVEVAATGANDFPSHSSPLFLLLARGCMRPDLGACFEKFRRCRTRIGSNGSSLGGRFDFISSSNASMRAPPTTATAHSSAPRSHSGTLHLHHR